MSPRKPKLTIGMATFDDYHGVYFSIQALRMYHPEVIDDIEILVVDNNPDGSAINNFFANYVVSIRGHRFRNKDDDPPTALLPKRRKRPIIEQQFPKVFLQESPGAMGLLNTKDT